MFTNSLVKENIFPPEIYVSFCCYINYIYSLKQYYYNSYKFSKLYQNRANLNNIPIQEGIISLNTTQACPKISNFLSISETFFPTYSTMDVKIQKCFWSADLRRIGFWANISKKWRDSYTPPTCSPYLHFQLFHIVSWVCIFPPCKSKTPHTSVHLIKLLIVLYTDRRGGFR